MTAPFTFTSLFEPPAPPAESFLAHQEFLHRHVMRPFFASLNIPASLLDADASNYAGVPQIQWPLVDGRRDEPIEYVKYGGLIPLDKSTIIDDTPLPPRPE